MKKIKTGKVEIGPDEFNSKKGKFRVNMFVDLDVVDEIRRIAAKRHIPYQTLINQKLREILMNEQSLEDRLARIEEIVLKKRSGT
jgi:predicted DNA binding CopG/RHH family protein